MINNKIYHQISSLVTDCVTVGLNPSIKIISIEEQI